MPSTYSPLLRLELIGSGEQANTWGTTTNINLGTLLEQAIAGTATITVPDVLLPLQLTQVNGGADQARCAVLKFVGTLTGSGRSVSVPGTSKWYIVRNETVGGFPVTLRTSGNPGGLVVHNGQTALGYCDGTKVHPVGVGSSKLLDAVAYAETGTTGFFARNGDTPLFRTISAGTGINVLNGNGVSGHPTISNTGVTQIIAGAGISVNAATGSVTIATSGATPSTWNPGTSAAPGLAVNTDSSTGLYSPGIGQIGIAAGGVGRLTIDANGKVTTSASNSTTAGFQITPGAVPSSPQNGDIWVTNSGVYARVNGATTPIGVAEITGNWVQLEKKTITTGTTIDFVTGIGATYHEYEIVFQGVTRSVSSDMYIRVSTNGGGTWDTGASAYTHGTTTGAYMYVAPYGTMFSGKINVFSSGSTTPCFQWNLGAARTSNGTGVYNTATTITGIRLQSSSGNFTGGTVYVYGRIK